MGCTASCVAPSVVDLNESLKNGDERSMLVQLTSCPKLLSMSTSSFFSVANTPLHVACESKHVKAVQEIVHFLECSSLEIIREALKPYCRRTGAQLPTTVTDGVRLALNMANIKGQTPLMYACFAECPELVKLLLCKGADPWAGDRCGRRTALHYAAMSGSSACMRALMKHIPARLLVRQGVRYVDARSLCGLTPLHYCIYFGNLEALRELLHHFDPHIGAVTTSESYDVSVTCEARSSPLHFAAVAGNEEAAREVLRYAVHHVGAGQLLRDLRSREDAAGQLPWQVALAHHPANIRLASLLHPGQPLERVVAVGGEDGGAAGGGMGMGPPPLATLAAAALRSKLLADLQGVKEAAERGEEQEKQEVLGMGGASRRVESPPRRGNSKASAAAASAPVEVVTDEAVLAVATAEAAAGATGLRGGQPRRGLSERGQRPSSGSRSPGAQCPQLRTEHRRLRNPRASSSPLLQEASRHVLNAEGAELPPVASGVRCSGAGAAVMTGSRAGPASASARRPLAVCGSGVTQAPVVEGGKSCKRGNECGGGACYAAAAAGADDDDCEGGADGVDEAAGRPQCEVCFAARVTVTPAGCRHGLCGGCAEQLCRGVTRKPLHCPFCRRAVAGFMRFEA